MEMIRIIKEIHSQNLKLGQIDQWLVNFYLNNYGLKVMEKRFFNSGESVVGDR